MCTSKIIHLYGAVDSNVCVTRRHSTVLAYQQADASWLIQ